jgi:dihydrofolate reductase/thymidylate synthase
MVMKRFSIIVCTDNRRGIGSTKYTGNKGIPWSVTSDMKRFQTLTSFSEFGTNCVIMGRKTYELVGALPNRLNIVVSKTLKTIVQDSVEIVTSLNDGIGIVSKMNCDKVFVIGGGQLYEEALKSQYLDSIYLTIVENDYDCDTFFNVDLSKFTFSAKTTVKDIDKISGVGVAVTFYKYIKPVHQEFQYLNLIQRIIRDGDRRATRNATTFSLFGEKMEFDLERFPLYTTKKMFMRGIFEELKFFLQGKTDSKVLETKGVNIWKQNTTREFLDKCGLVGYREGDMGPMYFFNVFNFGAEYNGCEADYKGKGFNQFQYVMDLLKNDPTSRRIVFTTFDPSVAGRGVLYPCHGLLTQFYVENGKLSCSMTMRSNDIICGNPFNVASYALLVYIMCELLDNRYKPGRLIMFMNDVHIYEEHIDAAKEQVEREPYEFPTLRFKKGFKSVDELEWEDVEIEGYQSHAAVKVQMVA